MVYTTADLVPLKEALLTGAQSVSVAGRTVTFRSQQEIKELIAEIEEAIANQTPPAEPITPNKIQARFTSRRNGY